MSGKCTEKIIKMLKFYKLFLTLIFCNAVTFNYNTTLIYINIFSYLCTIQCY